MSIEINKIAGAILGMATLAMGVGFFSGALVTPQPAAQAGYALPDATADAAAAPAATKEEAVEPIAKRLASADVGKGEAVSKKCVSCHNFKEMKNGTGPALIGVAGRDKGSVAGFKYSANMAAKGGKWDDEALDTFLANPKGYVAGTSMSFAGVPRADERAHLIAYLHSLK